MLLLILITRSLAGTRRPCCTLRNTRACLHGVSLHRTQADILATPLELLLQAIDLTRNPEPQSTLKKSHAASLVFSSSRIRIWSSWLSWILHWAAAYCTKLTASISTGPRSSDELQWHPHRPSSRLPAPESLGQC